MKRVAVVAALAVLATFGGHASIGEAQEGPSQAQITVIDAATPDYFGDQNPQTVCIEGLGGTIVSVGGTPFEFEQDPGELTVSVFSNDDGQCSGTPDQTYTTTVAAGDYVRVVIGSEGPFSYDFDLGCMQPGTGRLTFANGADIDQPVDVYALSQTNDDVILLASAMEPSTSVTVPEVPADDYSIQLFAVGAKPYEGPPLAIVMGLTVQAGYATENYMAGSIAQSIGGFTVTNGPLVCATEEPPATVDTTAVATTDTTAVEPTGAARPATPVSGTSTYTG